MNPPWKPAGSAPLLLTQSAKISYLVVAGVLAISAWLHLATLLVTVLFSIFALKKLFFHQRKWLAVTLFLILVVAAFFGFGVFFHQAGKKLPKIASDIVPRIVQYADNHRINLPFSDMEDIKEAAPNMVRESLGQVGNFLGSFAKLATKELVMLVAGIVIAIGMFLNREAEAPPEEENLYRHYDEVLRNRFSSFYHSFETVMGAQLLISFINTMATSVFLLVTDLRPYAGIVIPLTFICGMLPIVGNLLSKTLIVGIAFGLISPQMALWSLVFLVIIHKLEYLLNSTIIGSRIRHPMWMTLIALILGDYLMGIPGVILAPVILHYFKVEGSRYAVPDDQPLGRA